MNLPQTLVLRELLDVETSNITHTTYTMDIKIIKLVLKIENIFCVYRNYCMFSRKNRILINIRTFLELSLTISCLVIYVFIFPTPSWSKLATFVLSIINESILMLLALWYARSFKKLNSYINSIHSEFTSDIDYTNILEKKYKILKRVLFNYGFFYSTFFILRPFLYNDMIFNFYYILYYTHVFVCSLRYVFEYVVMFCILTILTEHVRCIGRGINDKVKVLEGICDQQNRRLETSANVEFNNCCKRWTAAYTNIKECSNLFNNIFGVQMAVVLLTAILYFIIFLYKVVYFTVTDSSGKPTTLIFYCIMLLLYIVALFVLSRSAYGLQISSDCLRRQLAKLLIHCPINDTSYKATRDFLRLVATRGLRTRAFGSLPIDMSLLPSSVMFFTTYTVIALQFNNVV